MAVSWMGRYPHTRMPNLIRRGLGYRRQMPWLLLLRFTVPFFVVVLILGLLLGAAPFWAAVAAGLATILIEPVIDSVWRKRHRSISGKNQ